MKRLPGVGITHLMRIACALLSLVLFVPVARAAFDPQEIPKDAVAYRLSFCARPFPDSALGVPPHAFLALSTVDPSQKRVFHAIGAVKGAHPHALVGHATTLTPVPATLSTADYAALMQTCLIVPLSGTEYQNAERLILVKLNAVSLTIPKSDVYGVYGLAPEDCEALFVKVLQTLPKKVPARPRAFRFRASARLSAPADRPELAPQRQGLARISHTATPE